MTASTNGRIRELNDAFRAGGPFSGGWLLTQGVRALGPAFALEATDLVQQFDRFGAANDPYGEHDFGSFELSGETLFWKIDYYDLDLRFGSPDPSDETITRRVLTLMLASEY